ncbi:hypothetical protein JNO42_03645 [Pseudomonas putida]|uniref:hypothetical protein n=1 Tax=Pseudomonas putida TaxID=303 RepID=UPI001EF8CC19|nr:hypothetical protein [Pseudomonas putida]ULL06115.1 hypothetical protein JNO42_03645 [Pseudomonas putida]
MSTLLPTTIELTWKRAWTIITYALVAAGVIVTVTWEIRKDYIENLKSEISALKETEKWKVPETIKHLNSISEKLDGQMSFKADYERLKLEEKDFESTKAKLAQELESSKRKINELQSSIYKLTNQIKDISTPPQEFSLQRGESIELLKNSVVLGIEAAYESLVLIRLNNDDTKKLYIGNNLIVTSGDKACTLTVKKLIDGSATFNFRCATENPAI